MKQPSVFTLERRQAAAAITWPQGTLLLFNPNPVARRKLRKLGVAMAVLALLVCLINDPHGPIAKWERSQDDRALRPAMQAAMKAGNRSAGAWLGYHFRKDYPGLLQQEAQAGDPTAMFIMGCVLMSNPHADREFRIDPSLTPAQVQAQGFDLVRKAAAAGNQDALLFVVQHGGL